MTINIIQWHQDLIWITRHCPLWHFTYWLMSFLLRMQSIRYLEHRGLASVTSPTGATADWREGSTLPAILRTIQTISTAPTSSSRLPASRLELKYLSKIYQIFIKWKLDASLDWVPSLIQTSIISDIHSKYRELLTNIDLVYHNSRSKGFNFISGSDCV